MAPQKKGEEEHVALDLHNLDDDYFDPQTPISRVLSKARSGPFAPGSLSLLSPIPLQVELERTFGGACYIGLHFVPAAVGLAALNGLSFALPGSLLTYTNGIFAGFSAYMLSLYAAWRLVSLRQGKHLSKCNPDQITMRNNEKFYSMKAVWPKGAGPEEMRTIPAIYCMVPHGLLPVACWIPFFGKMWSRPGCFSWVAAPALFNIPIISGILKRANVMPAKAKNIRDALSKKSHSVGIVLDGVAGIFTGEASNKSEKVHLHERKGIVAIALQAGVPIVPVFVYGHTSLYTVVVDPFGILKFLSCRLNLALTPFLGRWGWPFGPSKRHPLLVAFGDPIRMPVNETGAKPTSEEVDKYHGELVTGFVKLFDTHKAAYGVPHSKLIVV